MAKKYKLIKNTWHRTTELLSKSVWMQKRRCVILHELGHDSLHRDETSKIGGFEEFNIFDMRDNIMEFEANVFTSQIALPDDDFIELAERGYDTQQIARALKSNINLVAIKGDLLLSQGFQFNHQEHRNDFLKYNR